MELVVALCLLVDIVPHQYWYTICNYLLRCKNNDFSLRYSRMFELWTSVSRIKRPTRLFVVCMSVRPSVLQSKKQDLHVVDRLCAARSRARARGCKQDDLHNSTMTFVPRTAGEMLIYVDTGWYLLIPRTPRHRIHNEQLHKYYNNITSIRSIQDTQDKWK